MLGAIIRAILGGLWKPILKALGAMARVFAIRHHVKTAEELKDAKDHIDTRKRIDEEIASSKRSGAGWHDRLRKHRDGR